MKKRLVITDLTRMQQGHVCICGYDKEHVCVRPILLHGIPETSLVRDGKPIIFPFALVEFDFLSPRPEAPHTEDYFYISNSPVFIQRVANPQKVLDWSLFETVEDIFEQPVLTDFGFSVLDGQGPRSVGTIRPAKIEIITSSWAFKMPANWSNLVPAEKRAWSLELVAGRHASASRTRRSRSFFGSRSRRSALEPASRSAASPGVIGSEVVFGESRHLVTNGNGSTAEAAERRRHARMHVRGQALIRIARKTVSANLVNVSEGGMHCVVHDAESVLESGGRLESPLVLEDAGAESQVSLDVVANVSWHKAAGPGTRLGVVFTELADEQAEQLQRFLGNGGN